MSARVFNITVVELPVRDVDGVPRASKYLVVIQEPGQGFMTAEGTKQDALSNIDNFIS